MPLQNFWFSLTAERRHQRLQDFGFEAFFVGVPQLATVAMHLCRLTHCGDEGLHISSTSDNATRRWRCRFAGSALFKRL
jgi:hypothetical protein